MLTKHEVRGRMHLLECERAQAPDPPCPRTSYSQFHSPTLRIPVSSSSVLVVVRRAHTVAAASRSGRGSNATVPRELRERHKPLLTRPSAASLAGLSISAFDDISAKTRVAPLISSRFRNVCTLLPPTSLPPPTITPFGGPPGAPSRGGLRLRPYKVVRTVFALL